MDIEQRIAQFQKMASDDPDNDMAHFSLGNALNQAGRYAEAAECFERCVTLNKTMSRAYQMAGAAWLAAGADERAADVLRRGYVVSTERGDAMPRKAIGQLLEKLGVPLPTVEQRPIAQAPIGSGFVCRRTGKPGTPMPRPPFRGPLGLWIQQNISKETFDAWIGQGTKVINELRLDMSRPEDQDVYDKHMREYLGIDDELLAELTGRA